MDTVKVVRTVCLFTDRPSHEAISTLERLSPRLSNEGYAVQTLRMCSPDTEGIFQLDQEMDKGLLFSIGSLNLRAAQSILPHFLAAKHIDFNLDATHEAIGAPHAALLTEIVQENASKTFSFAFTFNNAPSTPYFPSANFQQNGFSVGLQATDLSEGCRSIQEWLEILRKTWTEIDAIFLSEEGYLGIDTSIAPLFAGRSSFLNFIKRTGLDFGRAVTTDVFINIARLIRQGGTKTVGLCGLMFACLEDFELADEYEQGNFPIERNAFLALHCGLGIDSYPIGVDEQSDRVLEVLKLIQALSNKYEKPLSVRFVSDGKAKIGQRTHFAKPFLKDVVVRPL